MSDRLTYCEPPHAWAGYPWHIRALAAGEKQRPNGGITGAALCGADLAGGWDVAGRKVTVEDVMLLDNHCCRMCAAKVRTAGVVDIELPAKEVER